MGFSYETVVKDAEEYVQIANRRKYIIKALPNKTITDRVAM